jgi:hypothetical protein
VREALWLVSKIMSFPKSKIQIETDNAKTLECRFLGCKLFEDQRLEYPRLEIAEWSDFGTDTGLQLES